MKKNPFESRLNELIKLGQDKKLDAIVVYNQANIRALTNIDSDNACLLITLGKRLNVVLYTDFRYIPMVHRLAPYLKVKDIKKVVYAAKTIGYEPSMSHSRFLSIKKEHPKAKFVDIEKDLKLLRAVKTMDEIKKLSAAEALTDEIWSVASKQFKPGMTELEMARLIRHLMIEKGEGEAFETIVCVGKNAAECHHVPDNTKWDGKAPILVDMGVKLNGYCSDMTRNLVPKKPSKLYKKVYDLVLQANLKAIAAAKPGMTTAKLDSVARKFLTQNGFGKAFGHSLGHGVGIEIHEAPGVSRKDKTVLKPGMAITIEPGVYLEGNLGVRIEDLILITETGSTVLSHSVK